MLPPADMPDMERLAWYQAARASEEERAVVEDLVRRREAGERLKPNEEAKIAYSLYGTAAGCRCAGHGSYSNAI